MLREYQARYPELAHDLDAMAQAVEVAREYAYDRGDHPMDDPQRFLKDVAAFQRAGVQSRRSMSTHSQDYGRTGGIGSGGSYTPEQHPYDSDQGGMVAELRALQRSRGWTP
jgi:hypothetical protein